MKALAPSIALSVSATPALAYIGPGAGLGAAGVLIAVVAGVVLLLAGFLWYPLKRMLRARRKPQVSGPDSDGR